MNKNWQTFLLSQQALEAKATFADAISCGTKSIYPLPHLGIISVTGKDAAKLLQGQITCNVNDVNQGKSSLAAMCNPKGRAIATFLLVKSGDTFQIILPLELLETVKKKFQMYVLRSDVKITNVTDELCLLGLCEPEQRTGLIFLAESQQDCISINFPGSKKRKLSIAKIDDAMHFWSEQVDSQGFRVGSSDEWRYLDILAGIPWVTLATSEEFIPQMLNLDKLGGISFNKGCYTGQEIVARTHYLGKSKREMFLAECQTSVLPETNSGIVNKGSEAQEVVGKVLLAQLDGQNCKMLVILQIAEAGYDNIGLQDDTQAQLKLLPFNT